MQKWEVELATLKNNNARLTSALQESTSNVEEWKRQLHSYKVLPYQRAPGVHLQCGGVETTAPFIQGSTIP
jgi:hypothetical protein